MLHYFPKEEGSYLHMGGWGELNFLVDRSGANLAQTLIYVDPNNKKIKKNTIFLIVHIAHRLYH